MQSEKIVSVIITILAIIAIIILLLIFVPMIIESTFKDMPEAAIGFSSETVQARVIGIVEEGTTTLGDHEQPYQILEVEILEGEYQGNRIFIDYGKRQLMPGNYRLEAGNKILVSVSVHPQTGELSAYFIDFVRGGAIIWLFLLFVIFSILIGGWRGLRSLFGILISIGIIIFFIIPQIIKGSDPVLISVIGAFIFLTISLYVVYGWRLMTHSATVGMFISLVLTSLFSSFAANLTRLTGFGDENVMFLMQQSTIPINMRGLLLAGMIIGSLGVLDDLVIGQSSAVFQLHSVNPDLSFRFLFKRAMIIGRDHAAASVNTLVLAYTAGSLPMLLLFSLSRIDYNMLINISFIAEEIVRSLVGTIGLFISIPITTAIASLLACYQHRLGHFRRYLGPVE
ncbi:MAG TPA: YibE/F family protein [Anaerolineae bacterium]|nr:YibE/F family protein [Anaerolineae bacterium]